MVLKDSKVQLVLRDRKVSRVLKVIKECKVLQAHRVLLRTLQHWLEHPPLRRRKRCSLTMPAWLSS